MPVLIDVLFSDLRAAERSFKRLVAAGAVFAFVGHFYIVEPYFRYKRQEAAARVSIHETERAVGDLEGSVTRLAQLHERAQNTLDQIRDRIRRYPDHLRGILGEISQLPWERTPRVQQRAARAFSDGVVLPDSVGTFEEAASWYVDHWFTTLVDDLQSGIVQPVLELEDERSVAMADELASAARSATTTLRNHLGGVDPNFWQRYKEKQDVAGELAVKVDEFFSPVSTQIDRLLSSTRGDAEEYRRRLEQARADEEEIRRDKTTLEARLSLLESPLGRVPVGLVDLIEMFPLLILMWLGTIATAIRRLQKLQVGFLEEVGRSVEEPAAQERFRTTAVCWFLPPGRPGWRGVVFATLLLPGLGIFARSALHVFHHVGDIFLESEMQMVPPNALIGCYVLGLLLVSFVVLRAWSTLTASN